MKRKPQPIENEMKDMACARPNIAVKLEMYEGKKVMQEKEHFAMHGATTLHLTSDIHGTGRIVIANSWFVSVKTAIALKECGFYSVMLVKTTHKRFPRVSLDSHYLAVRERVEYTAKLAGVELQAMSFQD